jgi:putative FmdB family regulatory protein
MPIYEYRCAKCSRRFSVLTLRVGEKARPQCPACGSRAARRLMSRFAMPRSEERRLESLADPSQLGDIDESDPKSVARWMRRARDEMGDEAGGDDFAAAIDEIESGGDAADDDSSDE